jgi:phytoene synthase
MEAGTRPAAGAALTDLKLAYEECRLVTRREAKNFYYAFLTLPAARRRAIYVAYAFCRYCDDSVDAQHTLDEKLILLSDLRRKLEQTYQGQPPQPHPQPPLHLQWGEGEAGGVFLALADIAQRYDIPQEYFQGVLSGVESDLTKTRFEDFRELRCYCYQVASVVGLICLQIFGYKDARAKDYAIDLGLAMQLTNIARDVQEDLEMGRIYLPRAEMEEFGYSEEELRAGVVNEPFLNLMRFQTQRARAYFQSGFKLLPYLSPRSRACPAVLGQLYSKLLDHIEAAGYDVLHHRISLSTLEKLRVTAHTCTTSMLPRWP